MLDAWRLNGTATFILRSRLSTHTEPPSVSMRTEKPKLAGETTCSPLRIKRFFHKLLMLAS
jgi:hypothetical protein